MRMLPTILPTPARMAIAIPIGTKRIHKVSCVYVLAHLAAPLILIGMMSGCRLLGQQPTITAAVPDLLPDLNNLEARLLVNASRVRYWRDLHNLKEREAHRIWLASFARDRRTSWPREQVEGRARTVSRKRKALAFR